MLYRLSLLVIALAGCDVITPNAQPKPKPKQIDNQTNNVVCRCECQCLSCKMRAGSPATSTDSLDAAQFAQREPADTRPIVTLYAPDWCEACKPVKAALLARDDLPFRLVIKGSEDGVQSFPLIRWTRSRDGAVMSFDHRNWVSAENVVNGWMQNR